MHHSDYVPLHLHTEYSLLDGAIRINELILTAASMKMPAVAMTDHGNLFGVIEFYKKAVKAGIKPIIGCEVYVAPKSRFDKGKTDMSAQETDEHSFHLILLSRDISGYKNLVTLVSKAYTEGFYRKPRIDMDLLEQYSGGLIGLTACLKGEVPYYLARDMTDKAREIALKYKHVLGPENYFIELQDNGIKEQVELNRKLIALAEELHIGVVATNDCHYLKKEDAKAQDILLCINTGKSYNDPKRMRFDTDQLYFKSPEEMKNSFKDIPEAVLNTRLIAERCNIEFKLGQSMLPKFAPPEDMSASRYLEKLAEEGLRARFSGDPPETYKSRLKTELAVIKKMGYSSYFLIVWDFIMYSKKQGIPVGPGRGSAAGSLVSYSIGVTEIDPIKYTLIFERFLNPDRVSMPDIDTDFCKDRRGEVLSYVSEKYGKDHVAQIITFGTMAAKAAIRDVARALDYPYAEADKLAKLVPDTIKMTIDNALKLEPRLKEIYNKDEKVKEIIDIARRLEGISRHASTHAAGVVISPMPLSDIVPLYRHQDETITTQFDMGSAESAGLIKFDLLGLKTLTVLDKAMKYIRSQAIEFNLEKIPFDDKKTFDLLGEALTTGIFQLESSGMRDILTRMHPNRFEDLIALVALYRPGPIGSGMIDDFIKRKKGLTPVEYELRELKEILDETYGVILYQEQVMRIANVLASFTMGQADDLRKAMGKKLPEKMEKYKELFIKGCVANGINATKAGRLFDIIARFAEYGFNKSHSAAYAVLTYQTAYLKANYPVEFMAATLSADLEVTDKIVKSIKECRSMNIEILPPDVNHCGVEFRVIGKSIRFGLGAVKGVGTAAIEAIIEERQKGDFESFEDFLERADSRKVNKKVIESLIKAGAFDTLRKQSESLGYHRAKAIMILGSGGGAIRQQSIFGGLDEDVMDIIPWDDSELLRHEKESLGFYITGSPMTRYSEKLYSIGIPTTGELEAIDDKEEVEIAGIVATIKKLRTRDKGEVMAYVTLEDEEGSVEVVVFPEILQNNIEIIKKDHPIFVKGTLEKSEKGMKIVSREVFDLDKKLSEPMNARNRKNGKKVEVNININSGTGGVLTELKGLVMERPGHSPLYLRLKMMDNNEEAIILTSSLVNPDRAFIGRLEGIVGKGAVKVK